MERIALDVTDECIGAIAFETKYLPIERFIISETPTNATLGAAFECVKNFNYCGNDVYQLGRFFVCDENTIFTQSKRIHRSSYNSYYLPNTH